MTQQPSTNHSGQNHQQDSNRLSLEQIAPAVGEPVQLQIGDQRYSTTLVGHLKGQTFIVTIPDENDAPLKLDTGLPLVARFSANQRAYAFDTEICGVSGEPFPCLYLAYPQEIRALNERQYDRVSVNIAGTASVSGGSTFSCVVRDISIGGVLIALQNQTGEVNDPLGITMRVEINGTEYELSLNGEIRSIRVGAPASGNAPVVLQGLAFNDLSEQDVLALAAFDLLPNLNSAS